jgi:GTPase SAR1 family protein
MESGFGILLTLTDFQNYKHDMVTAWENKAIQHMYCNSHLIVDNFPREALRHYMQKIDDICKESYIPTIQDLYYSKLKTVGIIEIRVQLKNIAINLFDTGGQRNERKSKSFYNFNTLEWVHHFENASCVVFTASLSDWATLCYEDDRTNRTIESLNLFEELVNKEGLIDADVPFVLILGKADSLPHISKQVPFNSIFPAYTGDNLDCAGIAKFISDKYVSKYKGPLKNKILPLVISGIDTDIVAQAITILEDVIVNRNTAGHEFKMLYKFDAFSLFKTTPITLCDIDIFCQKRVRQGRMRSNGIRRRN